MILATDIPPSLDIATQWPQPPWATPQTMTLVRNPQNDRTTFTYDNNGNLQVEWVGTNRTTHTWDDENRGRKGVRYLCG